MTTTVDSKGRVVLPEAKPGDLFEIRCDGDGRFVLIRVGHAGRAAHISKTQCLRAISAAPLDMKMDWAALRSLTREP